MLIPQLHSVNLFSQGNCDTVYDPVSNAAKSAMCNILDAGPLADGQCDPINDEKFLIKVYPRIVNDDNGNGGQPLSVVNNALSILSEKYAPLGIAFSFAKAETPVNESDYFSFTVDDYDDLFAETPHPDGIDIYFLPPGNWNNGRGPHLTKSCAIGGGVDDFYNCGVDIINTTMIAHEVGHNLGLWHTWDPFIGSIDDCPIDPYDPTIGGPCQCLDGVADTGTDPVGSWDCFSCTCLPLPSPDCPGLTSDFPYGNIMTYMPLQCREEFTLGQGYRMKRYLQDCPEMNMVITDTMIISEGMDITIDEPLFDCYPAIEVAAGAKLTITTPLQFKEGRGITIKPGGRVDVEGVKLSACDSHWRGITVEGTSASQFPLGTDNQGFLYLKNGSTIENAEELKVTEGGVVWAKSTDFNNCGKVHFSNYSQPNISYFSNCDFIRNDLYPLPQFPNQVILGNVNRIRFGKCNFESGQPWTTAAAISAFESRFDIYDSTIDGYYFGVAEWNWGSNAFTTFTMDGCTVKNCYSGAASWGTDNVTITNNTFEEIGTMVLPVNPFLTNRGVELSNCTGFDVHDNTFTGVSNSNSIGVLADNTGGEANLINLNSYSNLTRGNQAQESNLEPFLGITGLQYLCNTNSGAIEQDFYIMDAGIANIQGEGGNATDNTFSHPVANAPMTTYEDFRNEAANPINYYHLDLPDHTPENGYYTDNVTPNEVSVAVSCTTSNGGGDGGGNGGGGEDPLTPSNEQLLIQDYNAAHTAYHSQLSTYNSLPGGSPMAQGLEEQMSASKGEFQRIANRIIRSELLDTLSLDYPKIRTWIRKKESIEAEYRIADSYFWEKDTIRVKEVRDSIPLKFNLDTEQTAQHNYYVQLSELKIKMVGQGLDKAALQPAMVAQIQNIADNDRGIAGAQAKGLLNFHYGYSYRIIAKSATSQQNLIAPPNSPTTAQLNELVAWPNPAKKDVNFKYALPLGIENATIRIVDLNGDLLEQFEVTGQRGSLNWSTAQLPNGIYLYTILYEGSQFVPRKLVLLK